ncbi:MAG: class I SAM-dependent methyltransferase [Alphaproteobacteria bacterium HGW-Alphaproteobacteria-12]|nr:MAG: class I SAM-dependent methyltransferase [Alphaproteobacteria bacterium HGW-Alphaproteobacteria-12]
MVSSSSLKSAIKKIVPKDVLRWWHDLRAAHVRRAFRGLTPGEVFTKIYKEGRWGRPDVSGRAFCSGSGSRDPVVVDSYADAVAGFLQSLDDRPDAVDLGCGDFSVGSRIRPYCKRYVACDIVEPLIVWHREQAANPDVEFRVVDAIKDDLPEGDVVFVRQMFQHLSNAQIAEALARIAARYRYLVLTEHLPAEPDFIPNLDKPAGPDVRLRFRSGVVLTKPPFSLVPEEEKILLDIADGENRITTTLYRLR